MMSDVFIGVISPQTAARDFLAASSRARHALEEPVGRRFWHRVPWLVAGVTGMALSAHMVSAYQAELERHVVVAFFVPGVVYLADAVGTQTETLCSSAVSRSACRCVAWSGASW